MDGVMRSVRLMDRLRARYEHAAEVSAYSNQVSEGLRPEEEALLGQVITKPSRILDLGCGAGREALALLQEGHRVVAADISRSMLRQARQNAENRGIDLALVWMSNPLRLPVPNAAFDCVLGLAQLLSHIPGRRSRIMLLREIRRVLAPGGVFVGSIAERGAAADLYEDGDAALSVLERLGGWEEGDVWVWQPSEAKMETPLFYHLHTVAETARELKAARLRLVRCSPGDKLASQASADAHRYRFIVAR